MYCKRNLTLLGPPRLTPPHSHVQTFISSSDAALQFCYNLQPMAKTLTSTQMLKTNCEMIQRGGGCFCVHTVSNCTTGTTSGRSQCKQIDHHHHTVMTSAVIYEYFTPEVCLEARQPQMWWSPPIRHGLIDTGTQTHNQTGLPCPPLPIPLNPSPSHPDVFLKKKTLFVCIINKNQTWTVTSSPLPPSNPCSATTIKTPPLTQKPGWDTRELQF